jgi:large subunit ribosomal protein L9
VTSGTIADQLKTQFDIALDKKKIHLEHAIRTLGEHEVELRLHHGLTTTLKVRVESSTPIAKPVELPSAAAGEKRESKTEKRGKRPERTEAAAEPTEHREHAGKPERAERAERPEKKPRVAKAPKSAD